MVQSRKAAKSKLSDMGGIQSSIVPASFRNPVLKVFQAKGKQANAETAVAENQHSIILADVLSGGCLGSSLQSLTNQQAFWSGLLLADSESCRKVLATLRQSSGKLWSALRSVGLGPSAKGDVADGDPSLKTLLEGA